MFDLTAAHVPLPWALDLARQAKDLLFPHSEFWPSGVKPNLATLSAFLRFAHDQGTCHPPPFARGTVR